MQGRHWIFTIPFHHYVPFRPSGVSYIRGQLESGGEDGYLHWQLYCVFEKKVRLRRVRDSFGSDGHYEVTRSAAASDYVWKEATRVGGTQFELGSLPIDRASPTDWESVYSDAKAGLIDNIPKDILVRCYHQLRRIESDNLSPVEVVRTVQCYWGTTGSGKSRRAWSEATLNAYPKGI